MNDTKKRRTMYTTTDFVYYVNFCLERPSVTVLQTLIKIMYTLIYNIINYKLLFLYNNILDIVCVFQGIQEVCQK